MTNTPGETRIAHLSDLHFGKEDPQVTAALSLLLNEQGFDLAVITGDFSMRARRREFDLAREFINGLTCSSLTIPGNHDISSRDLVSRFLKPFDRYKKWINTDLNPTFANRDVAVVGLNSVRRLHWNSMDWSRGRINASQLARLEKWFHDEGVSKTKIVALHHPIIATQMDVRRGLVGRNETVHEMLEKAQVDVVLTGHLHRSKGWVLPSGERDVLVSQAGTACSVRRKGEPNSFNEIRVSREGRQVISWVWSETRFEPTEAVLHERSQLSSRLS